MYFFLEGKVFGPFSEDTVTEFLMSEARRLVEIMTEEEVKEWTNFDSWEEKQDFEDLLQNFLAPSN